MTKKDFISACRNYKVLVNGVPIEGASEKLRLVKFLKEAMSFTNLGLKEAKEIVEKALSTKNYADHLYLHFKDNIKTHIPGSVNSYDYKMRTKCQNCGLESDNDLIEIGCCLVELRSVIGHVVIKTTTIITKTYVPRGKH